jgi:hypothetical protein
MIVGRIELDAATHGAEIAQMQNDAVADLLVALKVTRNAAILFQSMLLTKVHGVSMVHELTEGQAAYLNKNPDLLSDPKEMIFLLENISGVPLREVTISESDIIEIEPPRVAQRLVNLGATVAVEPESEEEWREALYELAITGTRMEVVRFAVGILYAGLHSRVTCMARTAAQPAITGLCWVLRSDARTWALLSGLLLWAGLETVADTGLGAAILLALCAFGALVWLVDTLRTRFDAHPPRERKSSD